MMFYKQLILHKPEDGLYGDCFRTALACLLDMKPEDVPHFMDNSDTRPIDEIWKSVDDWLGGEHGLRYISIPYTVSDLKGWLRSIENSWGGGLRWELSGLSPRGGDHSVIVEGRKIIHDPHPEGGGITGPGSDGYYRMGLLLPTRIHGSPTNW